MVTDDSLHCVSWKRTGWVLLAAVLLAVVLRPADEGGRHDEAHRALSEQLHAQVPGRAVALLDLDALDHNITLLRASVADDIALRLVTKSLPSVTLIRYLMQALGTERLMVFSEPFLMALLDGTRSADMMLGTPLPVEAAQRVLAAHPQAARSVCWLVDTARRADAYVALAQSVDRQLRICVELDVGLRRGGADEDEMMAILSRIAAHPTALRLGGMMGCDSHVSHAPPLWSPQDEFRAVHARYRRMVALARASYAGMFFGERVFNSGSSRTVWSYGRDRPDSPVNEIAIGSAFTAPAHFAALREQGLRPAVQLAAPVLKRQEATLPFASWAGQALAWWDRNLAVQFFLLGGGWPADPLSPPGLGRHFAWESGPPVTHLLPNQTLLAGSRAVHLDVGDLVFFDPWEGDAMAAFSAVQVLHRGRLVDAWPTYRGGN